MQALMFFSSFLAGTRIETLGYFDKRGNSPSFWSEKRLLKEIRKKIPETVTIRIWRINKITVAFISIAGGFSFDI
jgi:hypothetical protein